MLATIDIGDPSEWRQAGGLIGLFSEINEIYRKHSQIMSNRKEGSYGILVQELSRLISGSSCCEEICEGMEMAKFYSVNSRVRSANLKPWFILSMLGICNESECFEKLSSTEGDVLRRIRAKYNEFKSMNMGSGVSIVSTGRDNKELRRSIILEYADTLFFLGEFKSAIDLYKESASFAFNNVQSTQSNLLAYSATLHYAILMLKLVSPASDEAKVRKDLLPGAVQLKKQLGNYEIKDREKRFNEQQVDSYYIMGAVLSQLHDLCFSTEKVFNLRELAKHQTSDNDIPKDSEFWENFRPELYHPREHFSWLLSARQCALFSLIASLTRMNFASLAADKNDQWFFDGRWVEFDENVKRFSRSKQDHDFRSLFRCITDVRAALDNNVLLSHCFDDVFETMFQSLLAILLQPFEKMSFNFIIDISGLNEIEFIQKMEKFVSLPKSNLLIDMQAKSIVKTKLSKTDEDSGLVDFIKEKMTLLEKQKLFETNKIGTS